MTDMNSLLILYIENELEQDEKEFVEKKLASDPEWQSEYQELKATFEVFDDLPDQEPPREYFRNFYDRLQPKLENKSLLTKAIEWLMPGQQLRPAVAIAGFAATFVIVGLIISNVYLTNEPIPSRKETTIKISRTEGFLENATRQHLERTQMLLTDVANISSDEDYYLEKVNDSLSASEMLLSDNRTYRLAAEKANDQDLVEVLNEIEVILMDLANMDEEMADYALPSIQKRIRKKNFLIKIEIIDLSKTDARKVPSPEEVIL